jgi:hypothetical protein
MVMLRLTWRCSVGDPMEFPCSSKVFKSKELRGQLLIEEMVDVMIPVHILQSGHAPLTGDVWQPPPTDNSIPNPVPFGSE